MSNITNYERRISAMSKEFLGSQLTSFLRLGGIRAPEDPAETIEFIMENLGHYTEEEFRIGTRNWLAGKMKSIKRPGSFNVQFLASILDAQRDSTPWTKIAGPVEEKRQEVPPQELQRLARESVYITGIRFYNSYMARGRYYVTEDCVTDHALKLYSVAFLQVAVSHLDEEGQLQKDFPNYEYWLNKVNSLITPKTIRKGEKPRTAFAGVLGRMPVSVDMCTRVCCWYEEVFERMTIHQFVQQYNKL